MFKDWQIQCFSRGVPSPWGRWWDISLTDGWVNHLVFIVSRVLTNMPPAWLPPSDLNTWFRMTLQGGDTHRFMGHLYMWDSHHCTATLSFLWHSLFDGFGIYDGNNSEQSNNFPLAITLPFGTLSLRGKWMCQDLYMSLVAEYREQIKVRIQMRSTWSLNSSSGSLVLRLLLSV